MAFTVHTTDGDEILCPYCDARDVVRAGTRKLKSSVRQLYLCRQCGRRFSNLNRSGKRKNPKAVLRALCLICQGYTYEETALYLRRRYRTEVSRGTLSKWVREFNPPYLAIRDRQNQGHRKAIDSYLFTHRGINYNFQIHLPKLRFCPLPELRRYLLDLPGTIDHALFEEESARCSQLKLVRNEGLYHAQMTPLNGAALDAVRLATSNRARHQAVEDYFLSCDRNTIAVEVPVWWHHPQVGRVTGHIDILQINKGRPYILDFKPNAARENAVKVMTQLTLYANALAHATQMNVREFRCAYFDKEDYYSFQPTRMRYPPPNRRQDDGI